MEVRLPILSDAGGETIVTKWHVSEGDIVSKDQDMLEVSTDKATFDIPSPSGGEVVGIFTSAGDKVEPGCLIAEIREFGASQAT